MKGRNETLARIPESRTHRLFYLLFVPAGAAVNLGLGVFVLTGLRPDSEFGWLQLATGACCCTIAGWLAASVWSMSYWNRTIMRQVAVWRRIADAFFSWVEEAPLPADALHNLESSLDKVVPSPTQR